MALFGEAVHISNKILMIFFTEQGNIVRKFLWKGSRTIPDKAVRVGDRGRLG